MSEMLFVLTTIFVAYVIYVVVNEKKAAANDQNQAQSEKPVAAAKQTIAQVAPKNEKPVTTKPVAKVASKPATPTPVPALAENAGKQGLKDPKTGEVATTYSNYRFTKRWIKEALVTEGLLDKVYKNDELNADIEAKIKNAVIKLETIAKYRA